MSVGQFGSGSSLPVMYGVQGCAPARSDARTGDDADDSRDQSDDGQAVDTASGCAHRESEDREYHEDEGRGREAAGSGSFAHEPIVGPSLAAVGPHRLLALAILRLLAAFNLVAALGAFFIGLFERHPWPGNAPVYLWAFVAGAVYFGISDVMERAS